MNVRREAFGSFGKNKDLPDVKKEKKETANEHFFSERDREFLLRAADNFIDQAVSRDYHSFVFLDESGRYIAHLIKSRWKFRFPDKDVPAIKFVKIGREYSTEGEKGYSQVYSRDGSLVKKLTSDVRKTFTKKNGATYFDDENILLVDDYISSGGTLSFTKYIFKSAFPKMKKVESSAIATAGSHKSHGTVSDRNDLDIQPLEYKKHGGNDAPPATPKPAIIRERTNYSRYKPKYSRPFVKPIWREVQDIKNADNPLWLKPLRLLIGQTGEVVSEKSQSDIDELNAMSTNMTREYKAALKDIDKLAQTDVNKTSEQQNIFDILATDISEASKLIHKHWRNPEGVVTEHTSTLAHLLREGLPAAAREYCTRWADKYKGEQIPLLIKHLYDGKDSPWPDEELKLKTSLNRPDGG